MVKGIILPSVMHNWGYETYLGRKMEGEKAAIMSEGAIIGKIRDIQACRHFMVEFFEKKSKKVGF